MHASEAARGAEKRGTPTWRSWRAEAFPGERHIPVFHFGHDHAPGDLDVNLPHVSQQLLNAWERRDSFLDAWTVGPQALELIVV